MKGARGANKQPGELRRSQNWIGGSRPGNAVFVPPPANEVPEALSALEKWIHGDDATPPLIKAGLAHVQFETIHPFLDGNGRIGRLLVALLLEHWRVLRSPLLYLSLALKRRQQEYYRLLSEVRSNGDWEGWLTYFLECAAEAADDGVHVAQRLHGLLGVHRRRLIGRMGVTVPTLHLLELLPTQPIVTLASAMKLLKTSKPTANKAISALRSASVLHEITGKRRDRAWAFSDYLRILTDEQTVGGADYRSPADG
jgi:Fic family protein